MAKVCCTIVCLFALTGLGDGSLAATYVLNTYDNEIIPGIRNQGWRSATVGGNVENYVVGNGGESPSEVDRNHFSFRIGPFSAPNEVVVCARLELTAYDYLSPHESITYHLFDVSTDVGALMQTAADAQIFNDLGSGRCYGSFAVNRPASRNDVLTFWLNQYALEDIQASVGTYFSIGGTIYPDPQHLEYLFGSSGPDYPLNHPYGIQRLLVETAVVPEPSSLLALLCGLGGMAGIIRYRRR